jgi:hypothetical protein
MKRAGASVLVLILAAVAVWVSTAQEAESNVSTREPAVAPAQTTNPATELKFDDARIARVEGMLVGKERREYTFDARRGQRIALSLASDRSPWIGMDLVATPVFSSTYKEAPTVYTNFIDGSTQWEGVVPANGTYTLRLGLLNAQARKTGQVDYAVDVNLK